MKKINYQLFHEDYVKLQYCSNFFDVAKKIFMLPRRKIQNQDEIFPMNLL